MQIVTSAGKDKDARSLTVDFDLGENLKDAVKKFGEDAVYRGFQQAEVVNVQGHIRRLLKAGKTDKEIVESLNDYEVGAKKKRGKTAMEKTMDLWEKLTPEERKALLSKVKK